MAKSPLHSCSLLLTISRLPTATDCKLHKQTAGPPCMHCDIHHPPQGPVCSLQLATAVTACGNREAPCGAAHHSASHFSGSCERPAASCGQQQNPQHSQPSTSHWFVGTNAAAKCSTSCETVQWWAALCAKPLLPQDLQSGALTAATCNLLLTY